MTGAIDLFTTAFNLAYLAIIWVMAILMWRRYLHHPPAQRRASRWLLYAVLVLGVGDLFHLVARAFRTFTGVESIACTWGGQNISWVGVGAFATSFTLAFFYLFALLYRQERLKLPWTWVERAIVVLLAGRLVLLFFPQNNWGGVAPEWRIYRNIPFTLAGLSLAYLFLRAAPTVPSPTSQWLTSIGWAVVISFACYLGTILLVERYPMTGMLMLPKTIAYVIVAAYFCKLEFRPIPSRQEI
ncbi:MAG: hypothetical protein SWK90_14750 [Chloroflexota bacterium]|nr:hypothetical protein [Chloroflexota bacterium]